MKTLRLSLIIILCLTGLDTIKALPVDTTSAKTAACRFMRTRSGCEHLQLKDFRFAFTSAQLTGDTANGFYAFNAGDHGFVIVSADDRISPVLAYSTTDTLHMPEMAAPVREMFGNYHDQIISRTENMTEAAENTAHQWEMLRSGAATICAGRASGVQPLITTTWDQSPYYNMYCPYDSAWQGHAVTGCVATAMAQVIRYWQWPKQGYGTCAYTHYKYGYLQTDYSKNGYNYANMPEKLNKNSSSVQMDAVARLMADCGIGVGMGYSPTGSGSQVLEEVGGQYSAEFVMRNYFGYVNGEGVYKYLIPSIWLKKVRTDLENGIPLLFRASKAGEGGHCFICDGYDDMGLFHFNWGWSGHNDGFYLMDSAYGFNIYQAAIFGLIPPTKLNSHHIVMFSDIVTNSDTIYCDEAFTVRVTVQNNGNKPFFGEFRMVLQNGQTSETVAVFDTLSLWKQPLNAENASSPMTFHGRLKQLMTNNYNFRLQFRDTNSEEWVNVPEIGNFSNKHSIRFEGGSSSTFIDTVTDITATSADVRAEIGTACSETLTLKAIQYRKSGTSSFSTVRDTSMGTTIHVSLNKLAPNTTYDIQSYIMVRAEGTSKTYTSELRQFTTLQGDAIGQPQEREFRIRPNPAQDHFVVETDGKPARLEIRNLLGQQVCTMTLTGEKTSVSTDHLPRGVYFILIENDTRKIAEKIILK